MAIRTYGTMGVDWEQRVDFDRLRRERLARANEHLRLVGARGAAVLRHEQHPLHHGDAHRHLGDGQADPVLPAAAGRRADPVGLRLRGTPPSDLLPVARRGPLPRRHLDAARCRRGPRRGRRAQDSGRARGARVAGRAPRRRHGRAAGAAGARGRGHPGRRRPGADAGRSQDQDAGRDHVARDGVRDGRLGVRPAVQRDAARASARTNASRSSTRCCSSSAPSTSRASTRSPASAAARTRTSSRTACCDRESPPTSTSCTRTTATEPATTGRSRSARRRNAQVDAYRRCRDILDQAIAAIRPGVSTAEVVSLWPEAQDFGFPDEEAAFALQYGHGIGLSIWEKPIFSRLVSFDHPEVIEEGMVFALETFWPATDGWSAARIEEELVVTADGCEVITRFPAEELLITAGGQYTVERHACRACVNRWADR